MVKLRYYTDVLSSWCLYCEPQLAEVRAKYGARLSYEWRVALIKDLPQSRAQVEWFYKRSGGISGLHLNPAWYQGSYDSRDINLAAEAARDLGFDDDRVRLALARAALVEGVPVQYKNGAADLVATVTGAEPEAVIKLMESPQVNERIDQSEREFATLGVDQRPAFVLRSSIGDTAVFSGIWTAQPLDATIGAMLRDVDKYAVFAAENPPLPAR
jgi:predicted DsbA family dithiol-disulfide isomerase